MDHGTPTEPDTAGVDAQAAELARLAHDFRVLAENASDVVARGSNAGILEWVSPSVESLLGWAPDALVGRGFRTLVHDDDLGTVAVLQQHVGAGEDARAELRIVAADGSYRWISVSVRPLLDDTGAVIGRVAGWRDIEEERAAREALALSEARLRVVTDFAGDMIVLSSPTAVIEWASSATERVVGWPADAIVGRRADELVRTEDRRRLTEALSDETAAPVRVRFKTATGDERWVDITANRVLVEGALVGFVSVVRDAEASVAADAALKARSRHYETLAQNATHLSMSRQGVLAWVSPPLAEVLGYTPDELVGRGDDLIHPDDLQGVPVARHHLQEGETARVRLRFRHAGGSYHWYDIRGRPVPDPEDPTASITVSSWHPVDEEVAALHELERRERRLHHEATHDPLTGLANRALAAEEISRALAATTSDDAPIAVLLVDLDHFKLVNDSLGHSMGDQLLRAAAHRLARCIRPGDVLARLGGDEFVVVLTRTGGLESTVAAAMHICDAFRSPLDVDGRPLTATASIGITFATADSTADSLLAEADAAMYFAKDAGRDRVSVFDDLLRAAVDRRLALENELHQVVERGELELQYQPEIDLRTGHMTGVEALLRWHHPSGDLRAAGEFIEVAEETGLILDIGDWVLRAAFGQMAEWQALGDLTLNVNLSARQLSERDLVSTIDGARRATGVDPRRITFEITETAIVRDVLAVRENLVALHDRGFGLAIDDFGTGYASLTYLSQFPIDVLKLDMSFVRHVVDDEGQRLLLAGVIALATSLGADTTAEGVEQPTQAAALRALGCTHGQGWLWAPALPAAEVTRRLVDGAPFG